MYFNNVSIDCSIFLMKKVFIKGIYVFDSKSIATCNHKHTKKLRKMQKDCTGSTQGYEVRYVAIGCD